MPPETGSFGDVGAMPLSRDGAAAVGDSSLAGRGARGGLWGALVTTGADAVATADAPFAARPVAGVAEVPTARATGPLAPGADAAAAPDAAVASVAEAAASGFGFTGAPGGGGSALKPAATVTGMMDSCAAGAAPITGADASSVAEAAASTAAASAPGFCRSSR